MNDKDFLEHFGILGMKWGRRKSGSSIKSKEPEKVSDDHTKKMDLKKKNLKTMSNAEIKSLNERLQLERQYKDLTKTEISPGRKFVNDILSSAAKQTASTYVAKYMAKGVEELLKKTAK